MGAIWGSAHIASKLSLAYYTDVADSLRDFLYARGTVSVLPFIFLVFFVLVWIKF
jgi:hypothetical protein